MKTIQEIIPNKINKIVEIIAKENISNGDKNDRKHKTETLLDQTTPKQLVKIGSKTPNKKEETKETMKESKRTEVVIVSFIKGDTANKIMDMQNKLIKHGVGESLKVKEAKIHITHIAL